MLKKIKEKIPYRIKRTLRQVLTLKDYYRVIISYNKNNKYYKSVKNEKKIFLISSPTHKNLGDHAIAYAQREFFNKYYPEYKIEEIGTFDVIEHIYAIKRNLNSYDILAFPGGGNFGVQYFIEEEVRRLVIKNIKNNRIILFPQTIDFGNSKMGKFELELTKRLYSKRKNLILVAREQKSYEFMKENFLRNTVIMTPDIVLYLNKVGCNVREGAMLCMRNDSESILDNSFKINLQQFCKERFKSVRITDTVIDKDVSLRERLEELEKKWNEFRSSEIVITDRLHGMIFAAITGTPSIVFSNYNHKVSGTYEWIKKLDYIKFINSTEDVSEKVNQAIKELSNNEKNIYDNTSIVELYKPIIEVLSLEEINK